MVRTQRVLSVFAMACLLLIVSGLSSCGPSGNKPVQKQQLAKAPEPEEEKLPVVYTNTTIAKNRLIRPYWLEVRMIPESQVPVEEGYYDKIEDVVGMMAKDDIPQGVGVLKKMVRPSEIDRLRKLVTKGMVAIALPMNAVTAMPFLAPNDRVDVIGTIMVRNKYNPKAKASAETHFLARNVRVLAVHRTFDPGPYAKKAKDGEKKSKQPEKIRNPYQGREEIRSVTVEVPPELAQKLAMAMDMSKNLRLATCSDAGTKLQDRDVRIDSSWLNASTESAKEKKVKKTKKIVYREVLVNRGVRHEQKRAWSNRALLAPYDEEGDAPLIQDGVPTGVKDKTPTVARAPEDQDLLEPLDEVDDTNISLPSLPEEIELPSLPE